MPSPALALHAPPQLWAAAGVLLRAIFMLFGNPEDIGADGAHSRQTRALLLKWLRVGEAVLRHLLLIEAAALPAPPPRAPQRKRRVRARRLIAFWPDQPEAWRVSFRCIARKRASQRHAGARKAPRRFHAAWPLAERAEAMLRAFNAPLAFARRLARRLTPARAAGLCKTPPFFLRALGEADAAALSVEAARARMRRESG